MKKKGYRAFLAGVLLAVLTVVGLPVTALAAEPLRVELPSVEVKLEGTAPSPTEEYQIVLEADKISYPMPEGSADGKYTLTITGSETASFPDISYSELGVYSYTIYQVKGSNSQCTYDETVYTMKVYITNEGVERVVRVKESDDPDAKNMEVEFTNKYPTATDDLDDPMPRRDRLTIRKRQHRRPIRIIPTIRTDRRLVTVPIYGSISAWAPSA